MPTPAAIQARDEAYASAIPGKTPRPVVELDNQAFDKPLYFISGVEENVTITLETGERVEAIACAFTAIEPGFDESGPTPARLSVDNIATRIEPYLRQAYGAILVTYRAYLGDDFDTVVDVIEGLKMKSVDLGASSAEGELTFEEIATQNFPRVTYDLETYPGLWNS